MEKGNVNGALKLLTNNMSGGILPITDETLHLLIQKHPEAVKADKDIALQGPLPQIHPVLFEEIDVILIIKASKNTKGGSGPSGLDADGWRNIFVSHVFGECGEDLRKALAEMVKEM